MHPTHGLPGTPVGDLFLQGHRVGGDGAEGSCRPILQARSLLILQDLGALCGSFGKLSIFRHSGFQES